MSRIAITGIITSAINMMRSRNLDQETKEIIDDGLDIIEKRLEDSKKRSAKMMLYMIRLGRLAAGIPDDIGGDED